MNEDRLETSRDDDRKRVNISISKRAIRLIIMLIVLIIGFGCGWFGHIKISEIFNKESDASISYITAKLEDAGELTTQQITYTSRLPMEKGSIPFITKKGFVMYYNATLRAGVEMQDVDVDTPSGKVIVTIPHAKVLGTPDLDPESIQFYDEKKALLNWKTEEDVTEAIAKAKADITDNPSIDIDLLLEKADEHAEELIHTLLDDSVNGREVVVKFSNIK